MSAPPDVKCTFCKQQRKVINGKIENHEYGGETCIGSGAPVSVGHERW